MRQSKLRRKSQEVPALGKREANKIDKLNRIRNAARHLFSTRGFDETTMRDIAAKAKVALGTLFLYASNKRDLLFLIANDTMEDTRIRAAELVSEDRPIIDNLVAVCIIHFEIYGRQSDLFRLVLRELLFYDSGEQGTRATRNRAQLLRLFSDIVEAAGRKGEIELAQTPDFVGWIFFSLLQAEIRRWIALERRDLAEGIRHLWASAAVVINGMARQRFPADAGTPDVRRLMKRVTLASQPR